MNRKRGIIRYGHLGSQLNTYIKWEILRYIRNPLKERVRHITEREV